MYTLPTCTARRRDCPRSGNADYRKMAEIVKWVVGTIVAQAAVVMPALELHNNAVRAMAEKQLGLARLARPLSERPLV
jgi:hypothetical protein